MPRTAKRMLVVSFLLSCFTTIAATAEQLEALQGTWVGTESGHEGDGKVTLVVEGNKVNFTGWRQGEWYKGTIQLTDDDGFLKLYGTVTECPIPNLVGKTSNGIYRLKAGVLRIAARAPGDPEEPKDFDDEKCRVLALKKND